MGDWSRIDNRKTRVAATRSGHPEARSDEVFIGNMVERQFKVVRTVAPGARKGRVALDKDGNPIRENCPGYRKPHPVFVPKAEMHLYQTLLGRQT